MYLCYLQPVAGTVLLIYIIERWGISGGERLAQKMQNARNLEQSIQTALPIVYLIDPPAVEELTNDQTFVSLPNITVSPLL
jgi:hypothetical protein